MTQDQATLRHALLLLPLCGLLPAQSLLQSGDGFADGDTMGLVTCDAGDIDKDGHRDLLIGAPCDAAGGLDCGSVWLLSGQTGALIRFLRGAGPGGKFGYSAAAAGDVDLDGYDDIVIGAPYEHHTVDDHVHERAGSAQVFSGRDGKLLHTFRGPSADDALGWSVAGAGDVDRDGYDDVLVGAPFWDRGGAVDVGMVRIHSGKTGRVIRQLEGKAEGDRFGWAVCSVADINRDKIREVLVGIEGSSEKQKQAGSAALFSGKTGKPMHELHTGQEQDYFGTAVASVGDLDGDLRDDLLIGGWNGRNDAGVASGIAIVFSSRSGKPLLRLSGSAEHDHFGAAVAGVGDIDGDGRPDLAVGAPQEPDQGSGYVRVFSGKTGAVLFTLVGESIGDGFGTSVSGVGDRNDDGIPDVMVGAPGRRERGGWMIYASPPRKARTRGR